MSQMGQYLTGTTGGIVSTLTGNVGGPVPPTGNNINVVGDGNLVLVTGNPGASTLTITVDESVATAFTTDSGTASPVLNNLNILGGFNITTTGAGDTVTIDVSGTTDHSLQLGNAVGALNSLGVATDGQIPIGSTGADPVLATLTAGTNISITNGAGSITIDATGGLTWNEVVGTSANMAVNNGYIANNAGLVTLTLPATTAIGDIIRVTGKGAGLYSIAQNAGQSINFGTMTTTVGVGGSITATAQFDSIELVCITADTTFNVLSSIGNLTVV